MPELPEVETMRRGILPVVGAAVTGIHRLSCKLRPITVSPGMPTFKRRAVGARIERIDRLGKRLLVWLTGDQAIVFEPRMTGLILLADPPSHEHLRFRLDLRGAPVSHLWYWDRRGLGSVRLLRSRQVQQQLGPSRLGPDALTVDASQLREQLGHRRSPIKVALLDQAALAGIGNLYASEILFVAKIDPRARCHRLTKRQWQRLANSTNEVLHEAIRHEGSTLSDGTYRTALNKSGGYQNCHRVYDRAGEPCPNCGEGEIQRIVQAQRATFFCSTCQTRRDKRP